MSALYLVTDLAKQLSVAQTKEHSQTELTVLITGEEARHLASVTRVRVLEEIMLTDGKGTVATVVVTRVDTKTVAGKLLSVTAKERPRPDFVLVQALAKSGRDELAIQAATELGIAQVIPWQAERSIVRWDSAKAAKNQDRWQQICVAASKQSANPFIPEVSELASTKTLLQRIDPTRTIVLHTAPGSSIQATAYNLIANEATKPIYLVVGPEGGLSPAEVTTLKTAGCQIVQLGSLVLRSSTAGPAALAVLNQLLQRW